MNRTATYGTFGVPTGKDVIVLAEGLEEQVAPVAMLRMANRIHGKALKWQRVGSY